MHGSQKTTCPLSSSRSIFNNLHRRNQHVLIKSLWHKFWRKKHQSLGDFTYHVLLYCYATLWCGPHLQTHNPEQYRLSIWDLFLTAANHDIFGYFVFPNWRIVLTVCHNRRPPSWHFVGKSFDILPLVHLPNLQLFVRNYYNDVPATMTTTLREKVGIAPHNQFCYRVTHVYNLV